MVWPPTPIGSSPRRSSHMATGKRASMREGPLADLFRKTTEDQPPRPDVPAPAPPDPVRSSPAAETIQPALEPQAPARAVEPEAPAEPRRRAMPHPSLE